MTSPPRQVFPTTAPIPGGGEPPGYPRLEEEQYQHTQSRRTALAADARSNVLARA